MSEEHSVRGPQSMPAAPAASEDHSPRPEDRGADPGRWLHAPLPLPDAPLQLFCLPPAGAGATIFRQWPELFAPQVEVHAVRLPGREQRYAEEPTVDPAALAAAISAVADRPFAIFGHSLGGRLGFEVVRRLRATGARLPTALYVAASRPPDVVGTGPLEGISELPDDELLARVAGYGSLPPVVAAEPELRDLVLRALRADLRWLDQYQFRPEPPLPVPIVGLAGDEDAAVPGAELTGWQRHTSAGFVCHTLPGDHFFPYPQAAQLARLISSGPAPAAGQPQPGGDRAPLGRWTVWRDVVLRTTGFPADGLDRLASPALAEAADAHLAGEVAPEEFDKQFGEAGRELSEQVRQIASDQRFREAVSWQNPAVLHTLDGLRAGRFRPSVARHRELAVVRYWQRYCGKNETIGFFGPVCWGRITDDPQLVIDARPGPQLLRERRVRLEGWALAEVAQVFAADPELRMWLRPVREPHVALADGQVLRAPRPPEPVSGPEQTALAACDGSRTAAEVVGMLGLARPADGVLLLERLVARGLLRWDFDLPLNPTAESVLQQRIAQVADPAVRARAATGLQRLLAARDRVAAAAGDPPALAAAMAELDREFTAITGSQAQRRSGQTYAGRRLCYEDTLRDLDVRVGPRLLADLDAPLGLLLHSARWLCAGVAEAYGTALAELYQDLAPTAGPAGVNLGELWFLAQGLLFGQEQPVTSVVAQFQQRWESLLGLATLPAGTPELALRASDLAEPVSRLFPDRGHGWSAGRLHSPDLQICAADLAAIERGDYTVVLGELHIGWPVFDSALFTGFHPQPQRLVRELAADLGEGRVRLLFPDDWPRYGARLAHSLASPTDFELGFAPAAGADRERLLPIASLVVRPGAGGELVVSDPAGRSWPLLELFSSLLSLHTLDAFKMFAAVPYLPRVRIDNLVIGRRSWRSTVGQTGLAQVSGDRERFLAARRWRAALGAPEQVFIRIATELKPIYVDFRSPLYVRSLCTFLRAAAADGGEAVAVTVSEMLPTPQQAWVPDAAGNRYLSELRLHIGERR